MNDKVKKAGVYAASTNWERLAYLALAAIAAAKYVEPWLATVILPAIGHLAMQARILGRQALVRAYLQAFQGASDEQAEKWAEEEKAE